MRARRRRGGAMIVGLVAGVCSFVSPLAGHGASAVSTGGNGFVRVNQVGYPDHGPKVAYVMTSGSEGAGATAALLDTSGRAVASIPLGPSLGRWNRPYAHVYKVDFSSVVADGRYRIEVRGPIPAQSPTFTIAPAEDIYTQALTNSRSFYENQRDGAAYVPSALRTAPAHLNDAHAQTYLPKATNKNDGFSGDLTPIGVTIDASGGWFDAGDYLKFVETSSYVVAMMLDGVSKFPNPLGSHGGRSSLMAEARFGLDWLSKMWDPHTKTLYYQVGIGGANNVIWGDHDIWRLPQADDTFGGTNPRYKYIRNRPVFRAGPPGSLISPNLAGRLAADFALGSIVFRTTDPAFAAASLSNAETIYALADTTPKRLLTVLPHDFYPETSWRDDLELGATELYRAVHDADVSHAAGTTQHNARYYLEQAAKWAHAYINRADDGHDTLNLYDVSGLAHFDLARSIIDAGNPRSLAATRANLLDDLQRHLERAVQLAGGDPFGFGYPWDGGDTVSHGAGLSVMASEYDALTGTDAYASQAQGWLDNILGADAWGASFIVGDGTTFPNCTQHQIANIVGSLDGHPPVLAGAAVEGPNDSASRGSLPNMRPCPPGGGDPYAPFNNAAVYKDNVESFTTDEPAVDLTATSFLAFAWLSQH